MANRLLWSDGMWVDEAVMLRLIDQQVSEQIDNKWSSGQYTEHRVLTDKTSYGGAIGCSKIFNGSDSNQDCNF